MKVSRKGILEICEHEGIALGPYRDVGVLNEARARLTKNHIESMVLKVKP